METRKNINRGYQNLRVWQDAKELYILTVRYFKNFPYEFKRIVANQYASVDSIHRNISEGYCRKSVKEYLQFLNYAQGSLGESVSGCNVYYAAGQLSENEFEEMDKLAYKLENGLLALIRSIQKKRKSNKWEDSYA
jgi:four helix bundle protein